MLLILFFQVVSITYGADCANLKLDCDACFGKACKNSDFIFKKINDQSDDVTINNIIWGLRQKSLQDSKVRNITGSIVHSGSLYLPAGAGSNLDGTYNIQNPIKIPTLFAISIRGAPKTATSSGTILKADKNFKGLSGVSTIESLVAMMGCDGSDCNRRGPWKPQQKWLCSPSDYPVSGLPACPPNSADVHAPEFATSVDIPKLPNGGCPVTQYRMPKPIEKIGNWVSRASFADFTLNLNQVAAQGLDFTGFRDSSLSNVSIINPPLGGIGVYARGGSGNTPYYNQINIAFDGNNQPKTVGVVFEDYRAVWPGTNYLQSHGPNGNVILNPTISNSDAGVSLVGQGNSVIGPILKNVKIAFQLGSNEFTKPSESEICQPGVGFQNLTPQTYQWTASTFGNQINGGSFSQIDTGIQFQCGSVLNLIIPSGSFSEKVGLQKLYSEPDSLSCISSPQIPNANAVPLGSVRNSIQGLSAGDGQSFEKGVIQYAP